ncbi:Ail/Lom family outer membrane beta-barrel protein [Escherichia coli]|uniref:Ail/Lom family outer membrane beta-barrel protein n=1 Tax=Escherichia coli TaxID=562 RepID=UPI003F4AD474
MISWIASTIFGVHYSLRNFRICQTVLRRRLRPSVRVNELFSAYAMAGVSYSRVSTFSGDYLQVTDNKGKTHDVLTGSDDSRHSNTSLAWGAGVQFNPTESVAIDIAYEGSGSGDWRTDGFIVGVGYKF